ncbi:MAG: tRNA (adenosine(37)-N6)-threonylcarbamoyltransferase complex dimerization subunit type 1 TsaB [Acidobacteriia bacterium]|nr:tRNA (adenosine(37)-N6)-threonylcarbamoyltransferase complex dimerization subunit type 1 TsaB [Terriglobia bacterium]
MILRVLGVDTSGALGSVAMVDSGGGVVERRMESSEGHGQRIFYEIEELLRECGVGLAMVDGFAAGAGPGSFTGVRIALSAVKGLAEALGKPAFGVSNLQALAWHGSGPLRAAVMDARRGQIYGGVFDAGLGKVTQEMVGPMGEWLASLPGGEIEFVTAEPALLEEGLRGTEWEGPAIRQAPGTLAVAIARIALGRMEAGERPAGVDLDANYVRRSDAEMNWQDVY